MAKERLAEQRQYLDKHGAMSADRRRIACRLWILAERPEGGGDDVIVSAVQDPASALAWVQGETLVNVHALADALRRARELPAWMAGLPDPDHES